MAAFLGQQLVFQMHRPRTRFFKAAHHMHDIQRLTIASIAIHQHRQAGSAHHLAHMPGHIIHRDHAKIGQAHGGRHGST